MTYDQAVRWLSAIGGSHEVVSEGNRQAVVVRVASATRGEFCARSTVETAPAQEQAFRGAFALACDELRRALG